ncbi:MAG: bifunctional diguanylate cyclase/phosphodiesterase [Rubrivivax sp.]|nr:bifunctional diguanylate cyclase/phosphodiesterase [Rubrivivax sp.]
MAPEIVSLLSVGFATLASATLLGLAAACLQSPAGHPARVRQPLDAVAVLLLSLALWWPLHLGNGQMLLVRGGQVPAAVAVLAPLLMATLAWVAQRGWQAGRKPATAAAVSGLLLLAWAVLEADPPATPAVPALAPALLAPLLTAMLMGSLLLAGTGRWLTAARGLATLGAAALLNYGAWRSSAGAMGLQTPLGDWALLAATTGVALLGVWQMHWLAVPRAGQDAGNPRLARLDAITGLPLRAQFEARLTKALRDCAQSRTSLAVMQLNLDGFRGINETHGMQVGDLLLEAFGQRLRRVARSQDTVARLSGNDFLLLVPRLDAPGDVDRVAGRVVESLNGDYPVDGLSIKLSCSVGVAAWPGRARATRLIACAEVAMREARRGGGGRHCIYSEALEGEGSPVAELLHDLRQAISQHAFELHFQPKIDAHSGKITGAEALLRWKHPVRGMVNPDEFVPLAERNGLIGPLGDWVIEEACRQSRTWRDAGLRMRVAINLSAFQMQQEDIVQRIGQALQRHRVHPSLVTCEITETAAMQDTRTAHETFRQLGEMGVHVSIDDFGTGYSSLAYLRRLPAEELKIDRAFVTDLDHSEDARAVVNAVVQLAHALSLKVVAEGVETPRQRDILVELGCDELQGFLFAKPMPARLLLMWAMSDRASPTAFRGSLFANTKEAPSILAARKRARLSRFASRSPPGVRAEEIDLTP